jgi:hypothetical protein
MNRISIPLITVALGAAVAGGPARTAGRSRVPAAIPDLEAKIASVQPDAAEQAFLQIPWRLNIMAARAESLRTGKPLFVWEMNGHPLGHT